MIKKIIFSILFFVSVSAFANDLAQKQVETQVSTTSTPALTDRKTESLGDFELIGIRPYFKNKSVLAKMTAQLISNSGAIMATVSGNLGDCADCFRGASLKGKIGIRFYGASLADLVVSRKQSASIQIVSCAQQAKLIHQTYTCEFTHQAQNYKLNFRFEP